jgi:geranylgeranyl transferase type-2 subunit alpha
VFIKRLESQPRDLIDYEFSITENAIYTEPDDQSAWWYHQFLLTWLQSSLRDDSVDDLIWLFGEVLPRQLEVVRNLLTIEPNSKWAMNSLSAMLDARILLGGKLGLDRYSVEMLEHANERRKILEKLCEIDPNHINRYKYLLR